MTTKIIELEGGILLEVDVPSEQIEEISGGVYKKVNSTINKIKPIIINTCKPIIAAWDELNREAPIEEVNIELGLSFESEGNVYITKAKAGANLTIKFILKRKE